MYLVYGMIKNSCFYSTVYQVQKWKDEAYYVDHSISACLEYWVYAYL